MSYNGLDTERINLESPLKTIIRKLNGRLRIIFSHRKTLYTPFHGKRNLEDTCLIFLLSILTPTQAILMKSHTGTRYCYCPSLPFSTLKSWSQPGNLPRFLPICSISINSWIAWPKPRRSQTNVILMVQKKHLSQTRTLIPNATLYNIHHRGRVTPWGHVRWKILLPKLFRKMELVILEAANTICALTLISINQKYTDFDVCKNLFSTPPVCHLHSLFLRFFNFSGHTSFSFFYFGGKSISKHGISTMKVQHKTFNRKLN